MRRARSQECVQPTSVGGKSPQPSGRRRSISREEGDIGGIDRTPSLQYHYIIM
jgi:hypothetical protein